MRRLFAWLCAGLLTFAPALADACTLASPAFGTANSTSGTTSGSTTLSNSSSTIVVTASDIILIIFDIGINGTVPAVTGVTDNLALTFAKRGATTTWTCATGVTCTHEIWWAYAGATTGTDYAKVTVGAGAAGSVYGIGIARFTGIGSGVTPWDINGTLPAITTNSTSSTTQPTATLTTNTAHDLLLTFCDNAPGGASGTNCQTAAAGWTSAVTGTYGSSAKWDLFYKSVSATQSSSSANVGGGVQSNWVARGDALAGVDTCGVSGSLMMLDVGK